MDCKQSEIYIMQHFEKTITPINARRLAKHVLICENCRELYLTFDEAVEFTEAEDLQTAPENFTEAVMTKVRAETAQIEISVHSETKGLLILRIVWGFSALLFGVGMMFILSPDLLNYLTETYPAISSAGAYISEAADKLAQGGHTFINDTLAVSALLFVAVTGTLLFVLHNGEKVKT